MKVDDLKRIVELEKDLFLSPWNEEDFIHELKENPMAGYYILEKENQIIGYIGLWFLGDQCQITTIATDRHFQGHAEAAKNSSSLILQAMNAVDEGKQIVDDTASKLMESAGKTNELVENIAEISNASENQSEALAQISEAANQIAAVVQENTAMAEESSASSEELAAQSEKLKELIGAFQLLEM